MNAVEAVGLMDSQAVADLMGCTVAHAEAQFRAGQWPATKGGRGWVTAIDAMRHALTALALQNIAPRAAAANGAGALDNFPGRVKR